MWKFKNIALGRNAVRRGFRAGAAAIAMVFCTATAAAGADEPPLTGVFADNFTLLTPPVPAPQTPFQRADGQAVNLGAFRGRVVLLNFWATWCAPCVREMPSLDRLQARLEAEGVTVVAVSQDVAGLEVVQPFFDRLNLKNLDVYLDPEGRLALRLGIRGLPTTLLIDRDGRVVGGLEGPAEWDSKDAVSLVRYYLRQPRSVLDAGAEPHSAERTPIPDSAFKG